MVIIIMVPIVIARISDITGVVVDRLIQLQVAMPLFQNVIL
jgi:hypothetical protein